MTVDVLICDEMPLVRDGIKALLADEEDIRVLDVTDSGIHAMMMIRTRRPDVVITGVRLSGLSGLDMMRRLKDEILEPPPRVIVFAMDDSDETITEVLHAGACGLLVKDVSRGELVAAVHAAARGQVMLAPRIAERLVHWFCRQDSQPEELLQPAAEALTPRERQILVLIANGLSTEDVAEELTIGLATVRTHIYRLRHKLGLKDRAQLVSFAYRAGLMQLTSQTTVTP
ncbi:response regulator [Streptomyces sp. NPDC090022]|uniref:response regulator n=1 Tax=Streptomyces sp. NPDC090022 TaxID=3365920 RepID=UPI0037FEC109